MHRVCAQSTQEAFVYFFNLADEALTHVVLFSGCAWRRLLTVHGCWDSLLLELGSPGWNPWRFHTWSGTSISLRFLTFDSRIKWMPYGAELHNLRISWRTTPWMPSLGISVATLLWENRSLRSLRWLMNIVIRTWECSASLHKRASITTFCRVLLPMELWRSIVLVPTTDWNNSARTWMLGFQHLSIYQWLVECNRRTTSLSSCLDFSLQISFGDLVSNFVTGVRFQVFVLFTLFFCNWERT